MKAAQLFLMVGAAAGAYWLVSKYGTPAPPPVKSAPKSDNSQVVHLVEETLHSHAGEDNPIVQAFEAALEQETRYEEQLAHDTGLARA